MVVTPTLKAAQAATAEVGARAGSAAWLAYQHGWRWDDDRRLDPPAAGDVDPVTGTVYRGPGEEARLRPGDLLLVDEAGMLDQDTARALLTIADETGARVALVGDRHQLPAVGRGGVLDLAHRWVHPDARVDLDTVHRFVHTVDGQHRARQRVRAAHPGDARRRRPRARCSTRCTPAARSRSIAARSSGATRSPITWWQPGSTAAAPRSVVVDTRDHAAALNAAIRDRLVAAGAVDDRRVAVTRAGQRLGAGDVVVTRRNDPDLGVANREAWTVTRVHPDRSAHRRPTPSGAGGSCPPTTSADTSSSATRSPATARKATPPPRRTSYSPRPPPPAPATWR